MPDSVISTQTQLPQVRLILVAVFLAYLAQMTLNPVIAPLAREVELPEWQIGVVISTAAIMIVLTSQLWGRLSQSWGRKVVLLVAMTSATVAMVIFAVLAVLGTQGLLSGTPLFVLFLLSRGVIFGVALAAVVPTAQAYIAQITVTEEARVKGMAGLGAVQGAAMTAGAVVGGLLAASSITASVIAVPILLLGGVTTVALGLRREPHSELIVRSARISPTDERVWPFLIAGFGMFTALGFIQVITGFIAQDRFALDAQSTGLVTGAALLAAGLGMVLAQSVIVPRSGWGPGTLLRIGSLVATAGFGVLLIDANIALLVLSILLIGLGLGLAMPGYTAGASLHMSSVEQGGLAGLLGATTGLTFVAAPVTSTVLYSINTRLPIALGGFIMGAVFLFVLLHPRFRKHP